MEKSFDLDSIRNSGLKLAYDSMYGGKNVINRLLPETLQIHTDDNPGFQNQAPEPIHRNLLEFSKAVINVEGDIDCGLATDGDA